MQRKTLAKVIGWLGTAVGTLAQSGAFGNKYQGIGTSVGLGLVGFAAHLASDTSAGHPDGSKTIS